MEGRFKIYNAETKEWDERDLFFNSEGKVFERIFQDMVPAGDELIVFSDQDPEYYMEPGDISLILEIEEKENA